MTEEQIERKVERMMDALDRRLMTDRTYSQNQYDRDVKYLNRWSEAQYATVRR